MTAEELLAAMAEQEPLVEDHAYCTIDPETRVITIPPEYQLLGVESDEKAERLYFQCPKIVGDNIDLSTLGLRINFQNANMQKDQYIVDDVQVSGDMITFSWLLSRRVTQYRGDVSFIVCAVKASGEQITNEWNTTLATAQVLEGLEVETELPEEETDVVNQLIAIATQRLTDVQNATSAANTAANNANQKAQEAENATDDARDVIEQITKDSYLHTALQSFIDTVTATPTAYGNAIVKKIEGFTRQETTTGAQLFDASGLTAYGGATFSVLNDGKDVRVTGKKTDSTKDSAVWIMPAEIVNLIKGKTIYTYANHNAVSGWVEYGIKTSSGSTYPIAKNGQWTATEIPSDVVGVQLALIPNDETETDVTATFSDIKIGLTQFETWEPYTGGQPAPNPDYSMAVQGVGYCGFFDGLYRTIYFDPDGTQSTNPMWFLTDSIIPCKTGDHIKVVYDKADDIDYYGIVYYLDGEWKSRPANNKTGEWDVPSGVNGFRVNCGSDSARFDKNSLRHLLIFVNDKYAVCIKAVGSNLCYFDQIMKTAGIEPDGDGIYYVPSENLPYHGVIWHNEQKITGSVYIRYTRKYEPAENGAAGCYPVVYYTDGTYENIGSSPVTVFQTVTVATNASKTVDYVYFSYGTYNSKTWIKELMISRENMDYVEPQNGAIYIPVDYPLFEGDKIIQRNGEYKLLRRRGFRIYDGSDDEDWKINYIAGSEAQNSVYNVYIGDMANDAKKEHYVPCNYFGNKTMGYNTNSTYVSLTGNYNIILSPDMKIDTVQKWKDWLKAHALFSVYELATPTEETLSPEAQKALYSIMATDGQTELTIVGVPADAGIQNQFLLPRNEDGALNTTAYCTAEKNKIVLNELVAQNLDARVNKLEIDNAALAEQTIIVE